MPLLTDQTISQQTKLADYCRTGEDNGLTGITPGRIPTYRRLVFSNVSDALERTYPLTRNLLTKKEWTLLVNAFFEQNTCTHPQIWRMPEELIAFVGKHKPTLHDKYPQLSDLLIFEWKEVDLYMMPDKHLSEDRLDPNPSLWLLNPEHDLMKFQYPVHQKNARFILPDDKGLFYCLGFRVPEQGHVQFINLTPMLAEIIKPLQVEALSIQEAFLKSTDSIESNLSFEEVEPLLVEFYSAMKAKGLFL